MVGDVRQKLVHGGFRDDGAAAAHRNFPVQQIHVVPAVGQDQGLVRVQVQEIQPDAGYVADQYIDALEQVKDVARRIDDVLSAGHVVFMQDFDHPCIRGDHVLVGRRGNAGVRLVDDPGVRQGNERGDDPLAKYFEGSVIVGVVLPFPRGGVHHGSSRELGDGRFEGAVQLWPADLDEAAQIEVDQGCLVPLHGGGPCYEGLVVGLGLVGDHRKLVAFAVVDVHMDEFRNAQRLEIRHAVVHVQADLEIIEFVEINKVVVPSQEDLGQRCQASELAHGWNLAEDEYDRVNFVEILESREPLFQLVGAVGYVAEVDDYLPSDMDLVHLVVRHWCGTDAQRSTYFYSGWRRNHCRQSLA